MARYQDFIRDSLHESLKTLGLSRSFVQEMLGLNLKRNNDVNRFMNLYTREMRQAYWIKFRKKHAPKLYKQFIFPHMPSTGTLLDVGCGRGEFLRQLPASKGLKKIGVDINSYPEWRLSNISFCRIVPQQFSGILKMTKPKCVTFLWTLHHTAREIQESYFDAISRYLPQGSMVVILEDSYSTTLQPRYGLAWHERFMSLPIRARGKTMYHLDYIANRILARDVEMPIPGTYRTVENWTRLARLNNMQPVFVEYMGFPQHRDVYTPQSLLVFRKI